MRKHVVCFLTLALVLTLSACSKPEVEDAKNLAELTECRNNEDCQLVDTGKCAFAANKNHIWQAEKTFKSATCRYKPRHLGILCQNNFCVAKDMDY